MFKNNECVGSMVSGAVIGVAGKSAPRFFTM